MVADGVDGIFTMDVATVQALLPELRSDTDAQVWFWEYRSRWLPYALQANRVALAELDGLTDEMLLTLRVEEPTLLWGPDANRLNRLCDLIHDRVAEDAFELVAFMNRYVDYSVRAGNAYFFENLRVAEPLLLDVHDRFPDLVSGRNTLAGFNRLYDGAGLSLAYTAVSDWRDACVMFGELVLQSWNTKTITPLIWGGQAEAHADRVRGLVAEHDRFVAGLKGNDG